MEPGLCGSQMSGVLVWTFSASAVGERAAALRFNCRWQISHGHAQPAHLVSTDRVLPTVSSDPGTAAAFLCFHLQIKEL